MRPRYERGCDYVTDVGYQETPRKGYQYLTLDEYLKKSTILVIRAEEIKPGERDGELKQSGYVWID